MLIQTILKLVADNLVPTWPQIVTVREKEQNINKRQKNNHDARHGAKVLQLLEPQDKVWIPDRKESGMIREKVEIPRSYIAETPTGSVRRNRRHLIEVPVNSSHGKQETKEPTVETERSENSTDHYTRLGRLFVPPQRLKIKH